MLSWEGGWSAAAPKRSRAVWFASFLWLAAKMNARIEPADAKLATSSWTHCRSTANATHHGIAAIPRRPPSKRGAAGFHHDLNHHRHQRITPAS